MESASTLPNVSFRQKPRSGQKAVFDQWAAKDSLNIQLPTGYGKTFTACGCYAIKRAQNKVNRVLFVFPSKGQLDQFYRDCRSNFEDVGLRDIGHPRDIGFERHVSIKKHRRGESEVYCVTIQALQAGDCFSIVQDLMASGQWMLVVDEYHHYGLDKAWGQKIMSLPRTCFLAMSATPHRPGNDGAFGGPDVTVKYRRAAEQNAVKPLRAHAYEYLVDAVDSEGNMVTYTTGELLREVSEHDDSGRDLTKADDATIARKLDDYAIARQMRWSGKYISPLIRTPIERLLTNRSETGYALQAIVGAMSVSHAQMLCEQINRWYGDTLKVDWVGTGPNGRSDVENKKVLEAFCPPKGPDGERRPTVDILVHVGMAGEGLDSVLVSEVIHVNPANKNNSNDQENGRAARYLPGIIGHINFDSSSAYVAYRGSKIMDAMDGEKPSDVDEDDDQEEADADFMFRDLPEEPVIRISNVELTNIDSGDPIVQQFAQRAGAVGAISPQEFEAMVNDPTHPKWEVMRQGAIMEKSHFPDPENERIKIEETKTAVNTALSRLTGQILSLSKNDVIRDQVGSAGDIKKRINQRKKAECGPVENSYESARMHYRWLVSLQAQIKAEGIPQWLR